MPAQEEQRIAGLIRQGGAREQPPAAVREAVRAAVRREWQDVVASRRPRRSYWPAAAAAAVVAALAAWLALPLVSAPAPVVATMARVEGSVEVGTDSMFGRFDPASAPAPVTAGEQVRSGRGGRAGLTFGTTSVRMDEGSIVTLVAAGRLRLERGAIYVDAPPGAGSQLTVDTPYGEVEHLGTQYETRLLDSALRVRVREGRVRVTAAGTGATADTRHEARSGDEMLVARDGSVERRSIDRSGSAWTWSESVAPPFDIENRSLGEFLRWVARETGRELVFVSPAAAAEADRVTLRGSVSGLGASRALPAVIATTDFRVSETSDTITIDFQTADR